MDDLDVRLLVELLRDRIILIEDAFNISTDEAVIDRAVSCLDEPSY